MDIISFNEASTANGRIENFIENPDSTSGIVTVPKVIASGETITIPAGRVAVLPNIQVDGVLNLESGGEVFIPSGATTDDLDNRIALKADTTYVDTQLSNKANTVDLKEIGVSQTWQDVTASRVAGTTYTNTTGKPILVLISSGSNTLSYTINGITGMSSITTSYMQISFIVPNGNTYSIYAPNVPQKWLELR